MSGTQALRIIKDEHLCDETPIIVLTADAIVGARETYVREGFTDYLSKPVIYTELEEILYEHLDQGLILSEDEVAALEKEEEAREQSVEKPIVLVISESSDNLKLAKTMLTDDFKGVFVKDEDQAQKYMQKHEVAFVIRDGQQSPQEEV